MGEQSAVVWNRLYFRPFAASFSKFGVWHGPPKALDAPKPHIVDQDDENIRSARRRPQFPDRRILRVGILGVVGRQTHVRHIRDGKNSSREMVSVVHKEVSFLRNPDCLRGLSLPAFVPVPSKSTALKAARRLSECTVNAGPRIRAAQVLALAPSD